MTFTLFEKIKMKKENKNKYLIKFALSPVVKAANKKKDKINNIIFDL